MNMAGGVLCEAGTAQTHLRKCKNVVTTIKVNFTLEQATKAQRGSGGMTALFL
jgi:hypothetical protein